jgi:hypothetical protein
MISERWAWFAWLWQAVCALRTRHGLPLRSGWWESGLQVEALAAWVDRYDYGEWDDPPGKLFIPIRDRPSRWTAARR